MIVIGLANMTPLGGCSTIGHNNSKFHGDCLNPFNPDFYPGGSQGLIEEYSACHIFGPNFNFLLRLTRANLNFQIYKDVGVYLT